LLLLALVLGACSSGYDAPDTLPDDVPVEKAWKPAISWIDDDFTAFTSNNEVTPKYSMLHDFCVSHGIFVDFALVPFGYPASSWMPMARVATVQAWQAEGFGFLMHPVHELGWYNYDAAHPHDASKVKIAITDCQEAFRLYGLTSHPILVWPGNSYAFADNRAIVEKHYECAIISSYNEVNHKAENDRYTLKRLSFEGLKKGYFTKSQLKKRIKKAVEAGDWIIFASHFYDIEVSDTPDETSYNTANVFEILEYANSLCPIRSTAAVWQERKPMWDLFENAPVSIK